MSLFAVLSAAGLAAAVVTPFGVRPVECVLEVPSGAHVAADPVFRWLFATPGAPWSPSRLRDLFRLAEWNRPGEKAHAHLIPPDAADFAWRLLQRDPHARMRAAQCLLITTI